jgi:hypothetical protein
MKERSGQAAITGDDLLVLFAPAVGMAWPAQKGRRADLWTRPGYRDRSTRSQLVISVD